MRFSRTIAVASTFVALLLAPLAPTPAVAQRFFFNQGGRRYHFHQGGGGFPGVNGKPPTKRTSLLARARERGSEGARELFHILS